MRLLGAVFCIAAVACSLPALACQGGETLFDDRFDSFGSSWGSPTANIFNQGGRLIIKLEAAKIDWAINNTPPYGDIDACVNSTWVDGGDPNKTWVGMIFWYQDPQNFYALGVSPLGTSAVWRLQRNRWLQQVQWVDTKEVRTGAGALNSLRVVTKGNIATLYVNDVQVRQLKGHPPPGGQLIGLISENLSDAGGPQIMQTFDDFRVTRPQ